MAVLKASMILGLVFIYTDHVSTMDFSALDFAQGSMMKYFGGKERTVKEVNPRLVFPSGSRAKSLTKSLSSSSNAALGKANLSFVSQKRSYRPRSEPSSQFRQAVQQGFANAQAAGRSIYSPQKIQSIMHAIKYAVGKRMFQFSRERIGEVIFLLKNQIRSSRPKRSLKSKNFTLSKFIQNLKKSVDHTTFDKLMGVMKDVTLVFVIDTTGSMSDEIETAKRMAVDIIQYPLRKGPVNYILSPFNDPKTGPVIFKDRTEGGLFTKEIDKIKVNGGGDCNEYALTGIFEALQEHPDFNSPMYVFTDALAKDNSKYNVTKIKRLARETRTSINFFISVSDCIDALRLYKSPYPELATATSGQVFWFSGYNEQLQLSSFTASVTGGARIVSSKSNGSFRKKRRAVGTQTYSFRIDDTIDKMLVSITTEKSDQGAAISLSDPRGTIISSGKQSLSRVTVYDITSPKVGTWKLTILPSAGKHDYFVKCSGTIDIDFDYNFYFALPRHNTNVSVYEPLIGEKTSLVLTMEGSGNVKKNTVALELVNKYGDHIQDVSLTPDNSKGKRYIATFTASSTPFKLKLKGKTKDGNAFERVSRNVVEPKHVLVRILYSDKDFTVRSGQISQVMVQLFNADSVNKKVKIKVQDKSGYASLESRSIRKIRRRRWIYCGIRFKVPPSVAVGTSITAMVMVSVPKDKEISALPIHLIVVA